MNIPPEISKYCRPHLAAICTEYGTKADVIIYQVVDKLLSEGRQIAGMRQYITDASTSVCATQLQDIESGECRRIAQGSESESWSIDIEAIEKLALTLAECLSSDLDLVVVNRFGKLESAGGGFDCVIQRALELDIPVLTVVKLRWQQSWHDYGGAHVVTLPANRTCVLKWCYASIKWSARSETTLV